MYNLGGGKDSRISCLGGLSYCSVKHMAQLTQQWENGSYCSIYVMTTSLNYTFTEHRLDAFRHKLMS